MALFSKPRPAQPPVVDPLDEPLIFFAQGDPFTVRDAFEGVQIFGGIGSGKTSGSGAQLAAAFLNAGFGGFVLTAKPDETDLWRSYAAKAGRSGDLVLFGQEHPARFEALEYERSRPGRGAGFTENLVELFDTLGHIKGAGNSGEGMSEGSFWQMEQRKLVRNAIDLLVHSDQKVSFFAIHEVIMSAARSLAESRDKKWKANSICAKSLARAIKRRDALKLSASGEEDFGVCQRYWEQEFPAFNERTRSIIIAMVTGVTDIFIRGLLRELFSKGTTLTPEETFNGKIVVLDLPQKLYNEVGVYAQVLFKFCWQRAVERRRVSALSRPVFVWADEAQHFVNEHDVSFQATARSSRVATVLLTQNLPNYLYTLGGNERARALVDSLLGNLSTKIFHNNTCAATNKYASELFAQDWADQMTHSANQQKESLSFGTSHSEGLVSTVIPREFSDLLKGGPENNFLVEAIIHQGGKVFSASGINALRVAFHQNQ